MTTSTRGGSRRLAHRAMLALSTILCSGLAAPVFADSPHPNLDANGVDLTTGEYKMMLPIASIGSGQAELSLTVTNGQNDSWRDIYLTKDKSGSVTKFDIKIGQVTDTFTGADGYAASTVGSGATVTRSGARVNYRMLDGTVIAFDDPSTNEGKSSFCRWNVTDATFCRSLPVSVTNKGGMKTDLTWRLSGICTTGSTGDADCNWFYRLTSIANSAGYSIAWTYATSTVVLKQPPSVDWYRQTSAELKNSKVLAASWPTVTFANPSTNVYTVTAPGGIVWRYTTAGTGAINAIRRPSASSDTTYYTLGATPGAFTVTRDGVTTSYNRTVSGTTATMVVTDAQGHTTTVVSDMTKFRPTSVTDALGRVTSFTYDSVGRPNQITYPEGNKVEYYRDLRGHVVETHVKNKPGSVLPDIVTAASFPSTCSDPSCNDPTWTKDALGNQTDYSYDTSTGFVTSVKGPAPISGANRPETRFTYTTTAGVALLTGVSTCQTGIAPACVGTADEVKASIGYDTNLLPTSVSSGAGDASLTATTLATHDAVGNVVSVDGPLSGTADTTTYRYNADRAPIGVISADPDGAGTLKRRALKATYNSDGQLAVTELGTVNGTSDSDWSAFVSLQQWNASYDANGRKAKDTAAAGGTTYSVMQYSYDTVGRAECSALRMNSAA